MRPIFLTLLLLSQVVTAATARAQYPVVVVEPEAAPRNTVNILFGEHFAVEYEHAVHPAISLFIGPALFAGFAAIDNTVRSELGFGGSLGARFFVSGLAPEGLFIGPVLNLGYTQLRQNNYLSRGLRLSSGAMLGYTWIFFRVFDLSLGVGANYVNISSLQDSATPPSPVEASYRVGLGVAF